MDLQEALNRANQTNQANQANQAIGSDEWIAILVLVIFLTLVVLPLVVANFRRHHDRGAITILNVLAILCSFGLYLIFPLLMHFTIAFPIALISWLTFPIMWLIALVWSFTGVRQPAPPPPQSIFIMPFPGVSSSGGRELTGPATTANDEAGDLIEIDDLDEAVIDGAQPSLADRFRSIPDWLQMTLFGLAIAVVPVAILIWIFGSR